MVPITTRPAPLNTETIMPTIAGAPNATAIEAALFTTIRPPMFTTIHHSMNSQKDAVFSI